MAVTHKTSASLFYKHFSQLVFCWTLCLSTFPKEMLKKKGFCCIFSVICIFFLLKKVRKEGKKSLKSKTEFGVKKYQRFYFLASSTTFMTTVRFIFMTFLKVAIQTLRELNDTPALPLRCGRCLQPSSGWMTAKPAARVRVHVT